VGTSVDQVADEYNRAVLRELFNQLLEAFVVPVNISHGKGELIGHLLATLVKL
jgi:hypothetical protein